MAGEEVDWRKQIIDDKLQISINEDNFNIEQLYKDLQYDDKEIRTLMGNIKKWYEDWINIKKKKYEEKFKQWQEEEKKKKKKKEKNEIDKEWPVLSNSTVWLHADLKLVKFFQVAFPDPSGTAVERKKMKEREGKRKKILIEKGIIEEFIYYFNSIYDYMDRDSKNRTEGLMWSYFGEEWVQEKSKQNPPYVPTILKIKKLKTIKKYSKGAKDFIKKFESIILPKQYYFKLVAFTDKKYRFEGPQYDCKDPLGVEDEVVPEWKNNWKLKDKVWVKESKGPSSERTKKNLEKKWKKAYNKYLTYKAGPLTGTYPRNNVILAGKGIKLLMKNTIKKIKDSKEKYFEKVYDRHWHRELDNIILKF